MSQPPPVIPPSSFQSTFSHALRAYKKRTRGDLILHPLAARLQSCDTPDAILVILQEQARAIDQSWNADEKLAMWLDPIVHVLYALSSSLGEGVGLVIIGIYSLSLYALPSIFQVSSPAKVIFVGIGLILSVCTSLIPVREPFSHINLSGSSCRSCQSGWAHRHLQTHGQVL